MREIKIYNIRPGDGYYTRNNSINKFLYSNSFSYNRLLNDKLFGFSLWKNLKKNNEK